MRQHTFIAGFIILLITHLCFAQQKPLTNKEQLIQMQQTVDSLRQQINTNYSAIDKKLDSIDEQLSMSILQTAQHKVDIANVLIQWMAALLAITTIVIAVAGFIGLREFNAVRSKEKEMEIKLNQMEDAIKKIGEVRSQVLTESRNLILCLNHLSQARAFKNLGQIQEAHREIVRALEMVKDTDYELRSELHLLQGEIYKDQSNYSKSISEIRKSIEIKSNNPRAYRYLGSVYFMMNRLNEAEMNMKKSLELLPDDPRTLNNLGEIYVGKKEYEKAEITFLQSKDLNPEYPAPYLHLGTIYRYFNQKDKSISCFEQAEKLCKKRIDAGSTHVHDFYTLGWANLGKGNIFDARDNMEKGYRSFPSKDLIRELLLYITVLAESSDPPEGVNDIVELFHKKLSN